MLEGMLELTAEVDSGTQDAVSSEKEEDIDEAFGTIPDAFVQSEDIGDGDSGAKTAFLRRSERKISCCLLYTSPSPRDLSTSRMPSSA